jgi:hypothetical protein
MVKQIKLKHEVQIIEKCLACPFAVFDINVKQYCKLDCNILLTKNIPIACPLEDAEE